MQRGIALHNPLSQDGHTHVCWLRSQAADSLDQSAMVQPKVEISVGDEVEILGTSGSFYQVCFLRIPTVI